MKRLLKFYFLFFVSIVFSQEKYLTVFEKGNGNQSATYNQVIEFYQKLDKDFQTIKMDAMGITDCGEPLHLVVFNPDKKFDSRTFDKKKSVILINNGIHAGEPDGIDASMMFFRDLATGKIDVPRNTIVIAIPVYNIEGLLNRNSTSRVNQNGPEEYGFRGNGRNFDLNRDMIKSDAKNTKALVEILHKFNPDVFIDNHVSNGADYQYSLTYIQTQPDKLGKELGDFQKNVMTPSVVKNLKEKGVESIPYVNVWGGTPDKGYVQFFDSPRYTTGYTSLFNMIGYVVETHMLKEYSKRVEATYRFMESLLQFVDDNSEKLKSIRKKNSEQYSVGDKYPIRWKLDSIKVEKMNFLGYEGSYKKSDVTTGNRLFYDRGKPFDKEIDFYPKYKSVKEVVVPKAYIIPKSWWNVIDLLKQNNCQYSILKKDTVIEVESYKIADYKTSTSAYEGHYNHRNTKVTSSVQKVKFSKGDYLFFVNETSIKYLLETLEPEAIDSFFNWNFFDTILQQKEGYSEYVFEDLANEILQKNPDLRKQLEEKKNSDKTFAQSPEAQLDWVYKNSVHYEKAHLQYPVYRIIK